MKVFEPIYKNQFVHDCEHCKFVKNDVDDLYFGNIDEEFILSSNGFKGNRTGDIYVCNNCIVIRYSNDLSDNRGICLERDYLLNSSHRLLDDIEIFNAYLKFNPHSIHK